MALLLLKDYAIGDSGMLEVRADFLNALNHPNLGFPNNAGGSSLGLISATSTSERQIQFGIKPGF